MKSVIFPIVALLLQTTTLVAQPGPGTLKPYRAWVTAIQRHQSVNGILYEVRDSSIVITQSTDIRDYLNRTFDSEEIPVKMIRAIDVRKKGAQGTGILVGGLTGLVFGLVIGLVTEAPGDVNELDQKFNVGKMIFIPLLGAGVGVGIGSAIGGTKMRLKIKGNQMQFNLDKQKLHDRSITTILEKSSVTMANFTLLKDSLRRYDGKYFRLLALGGQVWLAGDMDILSLPDGSAIPGATRLDPGKDVVYTYDVAKGAPALCPDGFHVPSMQEWESMLNSLGGPGYAAVKLPASFTQGKTAGNWWTSTAAGDQDAYALNLDANAGTVILHAVKKSSRLSVRCLRD